ncbi:MAG: type III-B CRISPR module-associated protein Cmr3 [Candidatus Fermentithermobacillus carboniphilus]|uniref:Type III-B CRISPR module-associated protein Cmr3 n=1 Tax=Candidatus Fermentithermobacillus carboniphilus TaxID=3085328 RepID=A0AAT9LFF9_9FIRM|nr:MAG: type III-B CRISPR module-associated protein Cmr3 [Candidatus Fermentithermobacillus carboniphilus]
MTSIVVEPVDVLLFRDGKPFSAGSDHLARSVFPPHPGTLAGFVRSRLLRDADLDWAKAREKFGNLGGPSDYGDFRITGFFLRKGEEDYVPVPTDLVCGKTSGNYFLVRPLRAEDASGLASNFPQEQKDLLHPWVRTGEPIESAHGFISLRNLFEYILAGQAPPRNALLQESDFALREARTIVGLAKTSLTSDPGRLATIEFVRMLDGASFHLRFEGVRWPGNVGLGTLGGEGRTVRWKVLENWVPPDAKKVMESIKSTGRFKVVLLTPAIFEGGWVPKRRLQELLKQKGVEARLVAAIVNRPAHVGGFDLHRRAPKPMFPAAPAGSVYYYEVVKGDVAGLVNSLEMSCISDRDWEVGMGLSVVGGWEYA